MCKKDFRSSGVLWFLDEPLVSDLTVALITSPNWSLGVGWSGIPYITSDFIRDLTSASSILASIVARSVSYFFHLTSEDNLISATLSVILWSIIASNVDLREAVILATISSIKGVKDSERPVKMTSRTCFPFTISIISSVLADFSSASALADFSSALADFFDIFIHRPAPLACTQRITKDVPMYCIVLYLYIYIAL